MESFIVYKLNETSYKQDLNALPLYGPYAAALSYIIGYSHSLNETPKVVYRGMGLTQDELDQYQPKKKIILNGFKSASLQKEEAIKFATSSAADLN